MRETRLSGSEGGAGSIPVPTPIDEGRKPDSWAGKPMPRRRTETGLVGWKAHASASMKP